MRDERGADLLNALVYSEMRTPKKPVAGASEDGGAGAAAAPAAAAAAPAAAVKPWRKPAIPKQHSGGDKAAGPSSSAAPSAAAAPATKPKLPAAARGVGARDADTKAGAIKKAGGHHQRTASKADAKDKDKDSKAAAAAAGGGKGDSKDGKDAKENKPDFGAQNKELVEMIEKEVMERNPNVKWDDIAELKEVSGFGC